MDPAAGLGGLLQRPGPGRYATEDGRETRWGAVVRSDSPTALTEAGRAALADYGVRAIVDLRLPTELADHPNPFAEPGDHGIAYTNVSFIDPAAAPPNQVSTLAEDYLQMLDRYRQGVGRGHCRHRPRPRGGGGCSTARPARTAPADLGAAARPGRVHPDTVAADYVLTAELLRSRDEAWLAAAPPEERAEREAMLARYAPRAEVMLEVLAGLEERYGGVERYLLEAAVPRHDVDRLRERLLAPAAGDPGR